ncbi:MAG: hypothetical protein CSA86_06205 [Arcobacter sp.]|nr:MAG: hypothetical protein CSA86_06205 [Arcobacter sp.]
MTLNKTSKNILALASILMALTIAMGAFGAHGLKKIVDIQLVKIYKVGIDYQFYTTLALFALGLVANFKENTKLLKLALTFILVGVFCFSGSLYALVLLSLPVGLITPFGGLLMIIGWSIAGFSISLAKELKKTYAIKTSFRDKKQEKILKEKDFNPFFLDENNLENLDILLDTDYLFINFPPSKSKNYMNFLESLYKHKKIKEINKIIFISSTSIYPKKEDIYDEKFDIKNPSSKIVYEAENFISDKTDIIFRCAGLMGYDRIAGKYFENKIVEDANAKVNYVHRDDVIRAIVFAIKNDLKGTFNLCSSIHHTKKEVYVKNALKFDFQFKMFKENKTLEDRIIKADKIEKLGFEYLYPNPLTYI